MARVESSILINAAPGRIRNWTDDLANMAEFTNGRMSLMLQDAVAVTGATLKGTLTLDGEAMPFVAEIVEAGIERLAWKSTQSAVALRGEVAAKSTGEGSRLIFSLETGAIGGVAGSRAEKEAIRALQDLTNDYVTNLRDAIGAPASVDVRSEGAVTA